MSARKYLPDIGWESVIEYITEHSISTGVGAYVAIVPTYATNPVAYAEVRLYDLAAGPGSVPVVVRRGEYPHRSPTRQGAAVLHLVAQAYADLDNDPWLWPASRRRAARGDG